MARDKHIKIGMIYITETNPNPIYIYTLYICISEAVRLFFCLLALESMISDVTEQDVQDLQQKSGPSTSDLTVDRGQTHLVDLLPKSFFF